MTGIKGQKWSEDKRKPQKIKCNIVLTPKVHASVMRIAKMREWSLSKTLEKIVNHGHISVYLKMKIGG